MFGSVKKHVDNPAGDIETIIGKSTTITGKLQSLGNIRIDGSIDGGVTVSGNAVIGKSGSVKGDVKAENLTIAGAVTGNVNCDGNLSIHATGQLIGDVHVHSLNIEDGGIFQGRSEMDAHIGANVSATPTFSPAS